MEIRPGLCRVCGSYGHSAETCDAVIEDLSYGSGNEMCASYPGAYDQPRRDNNAFPNMYSPDLEDHSNISLENANNPRHAATFQQAQQHHQPEQYIDMPPLHQQQQSSKRERSEEAVMHALVEMNAQVKVLVEINATLVEKLEDSN